MNDRPQEVVEAAVGPPPKTDPLVGDLLLALSGGGFRATLFHLGVMRALSDGELLKRVTHIASVSGGSVLAAHAVLHWDRLTAGTPGFEAVAQEVLDVVRDDVRNQIIRRLPLLIWERLRGRELTATDELQRIYSRLYKHAKLQDLPANPRLAILGTNVGRARLCWFTSDGFAVLPSGSDGEPEVIGGDVIEVAEAVASSSAFPVLFPPKRFNRDDLKFRDENKYHYVTDAGVYDNLALSCFLMNGSVGAKGVFAEAHGSVIVSDATATIDWDTEQRPHLVHNLLRSIDIIHQRSSDLLRQQAGLVRRASAKGNTETRLSLDAHRSNDPSERPGYVLVDIEEDRLSSEPYIPQTLQRHLSYLRTDLDAFSESEIHFLVQHGYCVTWHMLRSYGLLPANQPSKLEEWRHRWPSPAAARVKHTDAVKQLARGAHRQLRPFVLGDPATTALLAVVVVFFAICAAGVYAVIKRWPEAWKLKQEIFEPGIGLHNQPARASDILAYYRQHPIRESTKPASLDVAPIIDPDHDTLEILSVERVFDLRDWKDVSGARDQGRQEKTHLQMTYHVRRPPDTTNIVFQFKTSGDEVWPWVDARFSARMYRPQDYAGDKHYAKRWQVDVRIDMQPPHQIFSLTLGATYINAFQKGHMDAAFKAYTNSPTGSLILLFPLDRRATNFRYFHTEKDGEPRRYGFQPQFVIQDHNAIFSKYERLRKGFAYGVEWDWDDSRL